MSKNKTPNVDVFIKEYILSGLNNARKAAITAGYSEKTADQQASRLLKNVKVIEAIEKHKKAQVSSFIYSKEKKLEILQKVMDNAVEVCQEEGNFNKGKMNNHSAAIAAIKEHNLMQGDNAPTQSEVTTTTQTLQEKLNGGSKR